MIESISGNSNLLSTVSSQYSPEATGQTSGAARPEKDAPQKAGTEEIKAVYGNRDTVTISPEGAAYARQAAAAKVDQEGASGTTAKTAVDSVSSAAKTATDTAVKGTSDVKAEDTEATEAVASSTEEDEDSSDLSEYTDAELKRMMYKGDITQSEYDEEMVSRNGFTAEVEE